MKIVALFTLAFFLPLGCQISTPDASQPEPEAAQRSLELVELDGGGVVTNLGYGIKVNKGSSLHRIWFVLNDPAALARLRGAGIKTIYVSGSRYSSGEYHYAPVGEIEFSRSLAAIEVRFVLFDVWASHMTTLSALSVKDIASGSKMKLAELGKWRAWESDVHELLTVVAFVAHARSTDGAVRTYDAEALTRQLEKIKLTLTENQLSPDEKKE